MPTNTLCSDLVCSPQFENKCAYSYLPKAAGPDVGDLMVNEAGTGKWVNEAVGHLDENYERRKPDHTCDKYAIGKEHDYDIPVKNGCKIGNMKCFGEYRSCSYFDKRRAMWGTKGSGPLVLGFEKMSSCTIWILETQQYNRKAYMANWKSEMKFKVNDKECIEPHCHVDMSGAMFWVIIKAKDILGSQCQSEKVKVSMEIVPFSSNPLSHTCNNECNPSLRKEFEGTHDKESFCKEDKKKGQPIGCRALPRFKNVDDVGAYVGTVIWF